METWDAIRARRDVREYTNQPIGDGRRRGVLVPDAGTGCLTG